MDAKEFADFYRLQGYKVIQTESCFWYEGSRFFYQSIPYHWVITPSGEELRKVFFSGIAVGLRYVTDVSSVGKESYIWVQDNRNYDFPSLEQKARNQTRRGLEKCRVERIDFDYLERHGFPLVRDTLTRQGRNPRTIGERNWELLCRVSKLSDFEAWGAFANNKLAGFLIAGLVDRCFYILHQYSATNSLRSYPNNALIFAVTKNKLCDSTIGYISYGIQSLDVEHTKGLDKFKSCMGFKKRPVKQSIRFNPIVKPIFGRITHQLVNGIHKIRPDSDFIRKLRGILSFYIESREG